MKLCFYISEDYNILSVKYFVLRYKKTWWKVEYVRIGVN